MTDVPEKTLRVRIEGRVQGVAFRLWTCDRAQAFGLSGWVRNRRDGSVEALFSGPADRVGDMLKACRQGPSAAQVERVDARPGSPPDERGFIQLPTA